MSILIDKSTWLLVQGITGKDGLLHAKKMAEYGTNMVDGTSPDRGGTMINNTFPVFSTMYETVCRARANTFAVFVPAHSAVDTTMETANAGIRLIIYTTEGIPILDIVKAYRFVELERTKLIGPNCPGLISLGRSLVGILPGQVLTPGNIEVISRSGTLIYGVVSHLAAKGTGQFIAVGMGGDPVIRLYSRNLLGVLQNDPQTDAIVITNEIEGNAKEAAATHIHKHVTEPVVVFIVGESAPPGKRMGHAGAIISGSPGSAVEKISALEATGTRAAGEPSKIPDLLKGSF